MDAPAKAVEVANSWPRAEPRPPTRELQRLWFACQEESWTSLLVLPSHPETSAFTVAKALVETGSLFGSRPVRLVDARGLTLSSAGRLVAQLGAPHLPQELCVLCADSVLSSQASLPLAMAASRVLLCVELGQAALESARRTIEVVGKQRFLGSVALRPSAAEPHP